MDIIDISAGDTHYLYLSADGSVFSGGNNKYGQLGCSTGGGYVNTPTKIPSLSDIVQVAAANSYSLFLKSNGTVWYCGSGQIDVLFPNMTDTGSIDVPIQIPNLFNIIQIVAYSFRPCFLQGDGTVIQYNGNASNPENQRKVFDTTDVISIVSAYDHIYFIHHNRRVSVYSTYTPNTFLIQAVNTRKYLLGVTDVIQVLPFEKGAVFLKIDGSVWIQGNVYGYEDVEDSSRLMKVVERDIIRLFSYKKLPMILNREGTLSVLGTNPSLHGGRILGRNVVSATGFGRSGDLILLHTNSTISNYSFRQ